MMSSEGGYVINGALQLFRERIETSLPLRHFTEFHEDSKIDKVSLEERARILVEFMPNIAGVSASHVIPGMVKQLLSTIEEATEQLRRRNEEQKMKTGAVIDKFIEAHCLKYWLSMKTQKLSPHTEVEQGSRDREYILEMAKSKVIRSFEEDWLPPIMSAEFRLEQRAKLEMKLELIQNQMDASSGKLVAERVEDLENASTVDAPVSTVELEYHDNSIDLNDTSEHVVSSPVSDSLLEGHYPEGSITSSDFPLDLRMKPKSFPENNARLNSTVSAEGLPSRLVGFCQEAGKLHVPPLHQESIAATVPKKNKDNWDKCPVTKTIVYSGHTEFVGRKFRMFQCNFCRKKFKSKVCLKNHERCGIVGRSGYREKPFTCRECNWCFTSAASLKNHKKVHSGRFTCKPCSKGFRSKGELDRHLRVHSGERPFQCSICSARFGRKFTRDNHMERLHKQPAKVSKKNASKVPMEKWDYSHPKLGCSDQYVKLHEPHAFHGSDYQ